ncbi:TetR family transcriptional regulator [Ktedonobacter sp. SOSP1-52]|uniref:TetR/AcrR family transcriptional regulator n=1 Tax=Ktedonobacter sp. SOSP1-52 TaxID=2778366 RepID=UPI001915BCCE|nr:TetR/AcrR family transcriptional regulator [Ktedonobacter sp. SOSP1-52]GHO69800.1 TetR family transcriptional regulator [Ktedonobacter sp. SOSP1-52]
MPKVVDEQMREATRRHIIRQAASEFARLGFDQANINMIAEQAGIGKGTIYLYFENKRELFLSMLRYIAQDHLMAIRAAPATDGNIQQRLERLFCAFVQLAQEERDSFNVYMSALYGVNRAFQAEATKLMRDYLATIAFMLEQSQARGEIRCANVESTALMVLSLMESFVLSANVLGQSEQVILQQASKVAEMVLHGIASA